MPSIIHLMAKHPKRRSDMGRYMRGGIDEVVSLTTLAPSTLVSALFDETVVERTLCTSIVCRYSLADFTPAANTGPILVGIAHSDYSDAEIEAWIENSDSWNVSDVVAEREVGRRLCRRVGIFDVPEDATKADVLNNGKAIKTKLNWMLASNQTLRLWAYNMGTAAIATTVPQVRAQGHANLFSK